MISKDSIVARNYVFKYGHYFNLKEEKIQAYKEFGKFAEEILIGIGREDLIPNGLNGVWWDEVKQFVNKGVIPWRIIEKNLLEEF